MVECCLGQRCLGVNQQEAVALGQQCAGGWGMLVLLRDRGMICRVVRDELDYAETLGDGQGPDGGDDLIDGHGSAGCHVPHRSGRAERGR